jgi:hypothetical protein
MPAPVVLNECPAIAGQAVLLTATPVAPCTCPVITQFLNWVMPDSGDPNAWMGTDWRLEWDPTNKVYNLEYMAEGDSWSSVAFSCSPSFRATFYNVVINEGACEYDITITGAGPVIDAKKSK